jgi:hypothetical protein
VVSNAIVASTLKKKTQKNLEQQHRSPNPCGLATLIPPTNYIGVMNNLGAYPATVHGQGRYVKETERSIISG